jgi:MoaA/NifB/PqqE/SkfB family radical SAM enzyme
MTAGRRLAARLRGPRLEAIQLEVTNRCPLRCVTCPRVALADRWPPRDLAWPVFLRVARAFPHARFVHLQGWGEPLLHPRLLDMVRVARAAGCRVGFTTSGMLLHGDVIGRVLDSGLDLVAVSLAGATAATHEAIRVGSDLARVLDGVRRLVAARAGRRRRRLQIQLFFLMTTANLSELPAVIDLAGDLGADGVVATNLDCVVTAEHDRLRAFGTPPAGVLAGHLVEAAARARAGGVTFRPYPLETGAVAVCDAAPLDVVFVAADGSVAPCAWMAVGREPTLPRWAGGRVIEVARPSFGNVAETDLVGIWRSPGYTAFRRGFAARRAAAVAAAVTTAAGPIALPPAPPSCAGCPKLLGV